MHSHYSRYDGKLRKNPFLQKHYECLPFIGEKYENSRILLIGESHYVSREEVKFVNREDFYDIKFDDLNDGKYKDWINTRSVFERRVYEKHDFKSFFNNPATEMAKVIYLTDGPSFDQKIDAMHHYAFMNYFKRPSYESGKTISALTKADYEYAYNISKYIIEVLKPKMIIFLSKKAYNAFVDADNDNVIRSACTVTSVCHPSSCWWHRQRKNGAIAREEFRELIDGTLNGLSCVFDTCQLFLEHYLIYRAFFDKYGKTCDGEKRQLMVLSCNAHLEICILLWCKLFGSKENNVLHYSNYISPNEFKISLNQSFGIKTEDFEEYINRVKKFRNEYIAHYDKTKCAVPILDKAIKAVFLLDSMIEPENSLIPFGTLKDSYEASNDKYFDIVERLAEDL